MRAAGFWESGLEADESNSEKWSMTWGSEGLAKTQKSGGTLLCFSILLDRLVKTVLRRLKSLYRRRDI